MLKLTIDVTGREVLVISNTTLAQQTRNAARSTITVVPKQIIAAATDQLPLIHNQMIATGHVELVLIIKSLVLQIGIAALSLTKDAYFQQTTAAAVIKANDT
ncbi:hypothetical protein ABFA07_014871 [Porites harrisoni]